MKRIITRAMPAMGVASMLPSIAGAVTLGHTIGTIGSLINALIPIILAIAVLAFFWGLAMYIFNKSNEGAAKEGIQIMVGGIIAIFIMVSIWGIVRVLQSTFKVDSSSPIVPDVIQRTISY